MATSTLSTKFGLIVLALATAALIAVSSLGWNGLRFDLTENQIYTLSNGTRNILRELEHPVELQFFFSEQQTNEATALRNYAQRVRELLEEYAQIGGSKIDLQIIDPQPFSEQEDAADGFGLQRVRLTAGGSELFFGLVGQREGGTAETIAFLHPDREEFLEQDISKLIFAASRGRKPVIGLLSSLDVNGGFNMMARQPTQPWAAISQLRNLYDVRPISAQDTRIADDIDLLLMIQPGELPEAMQYAIDQYVVRGGNAMVFADPINDLQQMQRGPSPVLEAEKSIDRLLTHWGVQLDRETIVGDAKHALSVGRGADRKPIRHVAIQSYGQGNFPLQDAITNKLEVIHIASAGTLKSIEDGAAEFQPLIISSNEAMQIPRENFEPIADPEKLLADYAPSGEQYVLAAQISGSINSAFPGGYTPPEPEEEAESESAASGDDGETTETVEDSEIEEEPIEHVESSENPVNIIVVADSDILSDRLWVQVQDFFGQQIAQPFADNGDFLLNATDNLLGNADLISIRGRGRYARPFTVVENLQREADARFQNKERELLARLDATEAKLAELQQNKTEGEDVLTLSDEQVNALEEFRQEQLTIRKELREVRHQLGSDIETLGSWLKFINIAALPLLITLLVLVMRVSRNKKAAHA